MEMIMKAFEAMEKAEQRKKEQHDGSGSNTAGSGIAALPLTAAATTPIADRSSQSSSSINKRRRSNSLKNHNNQNESNLDASSADEMKQQQQQDQSKRSMRKKGRKSGPSTPQRRRSRALSGGSVSNVSENENNDSTPGTGFYSNSGGMTSSTTTTTTTTTNTNNQNGPFRFPKTKKMLMSDWYQGSETGGGGAIVGEEDDVSSSYLRGSRSPPGIATHLLRSTAQSPVKSVCSAKKRWLRQAISEDHSEEPISNVIIHNGSSSPSVEELPIPNSAGGDYVTPLKKRRLASYKDEQTEEEEEDHHQQQQHHHHESTEKYPSSLKKKLLKNMVLEAVLDKAMEDMLGPDNKARKEEVGDEEGKKEKNAEEKGAMACYYPVTEEAATRPKKQDIVKEIDLIKKEKVVITEEKIKSEVEEEVNAKSEEALIKGRVTRQTKEAAAAAAGTVKNEGGTSGSSDSVFPLLVDREVITPERVHNVQVTPHYQPPNHPQIVSSAPVSATTPTDTISAATIKTPEPNAVFKSFFQSDVNIEKLEAELEASKRQREAGFKDIIGEPPITCDNNEKIDSSLGSLPLIVNSPSNTSASCDSPHNNKVPSDGFKKEDNTVPVNYDDSNILQPSTDDQLFKTVGSSSSPPSSPLQAPEPKGILHPSKPERDSSTLPPTSTLERTTPTSTNKASSSVKGAKRTKTTTSPPEAISPSLSIALSTQKAAAPAAAVATSFSPSAPLAPAASSSSTTAQASKTDDVSSRPKEKRRVSLADYKRRRKNTSCEAADPSTPNLTLQNSSTKLSSLCSHPLAKRSSIPPTTHSSSCPTTNQIEDGGTPTQDEQLGSNSSSGSVSTASGLGLSSIASTSSATIVPTLSTLPLFEKLQKLEQAQKENKKKGIIKKIYQPSLHSERKTRQTKYKRKTKNKLDKQCI